MRVRSRWGNGGLAFACLLVAVPALAQITMIPRPQYAVSIAPRYAAVADVDRDGFEDMVVTDDHTDKIIVALGNGRGTFRKGAEIGVGQRVGRLAVGDVTGDTWPDIVTLDYNLRRFYVLANGGVDNPGTFRLARPLDLHLSAPRAAAVRPVDIAIGHLGSATGPLGRIAILGRDFGGMRADRLFVLHSGDNPEDLLTGSVPIGDQPRRLLLADLNGDGFDDALVLNTGDSNADVVSVLANQGQAEAEFAAPTEYDVGINAVDMASGDFNGDGAPDIAVISGEPRGINRNQFTVTILLNDGGQLRVIEPRDQLSCPTSLAGIPILCTPVSITTADFDDDQRIDYAVSCGTAPVDAGAQHTTGIVIAKAGLGDGSFDLVTGVAVGFDPGQIVAADFDGDGVPDIAVTEQGSRTVRILQQIGGLPFIGQPCRSRCASGDCVDGICCAARSCPNGMRCDIDGHLGACAAPNQNGGSCESPDHCASGNCVDGFCCEQRGCPQGLFCNSGMCAPPAPTPGSSCRRDEECVSQHCTDGVCCVDARCPPDESCSIPGFEGACKVRLPNGDPCSDDRHCRSEFCTDGVCCEVGQCAEGSSCALPNREGRCVAKPTPTPTPFPTSMRPTPSVSIAAPVDADGCRLDSHATAAWEVFLVFAALVVRRAGWRRAV